MTSVRAGTVESMGAVLAGCPESRQAGLRNPVVERVGYRGRSVTFLVSRTVIAACDRDPKARAIYGPWCGASGWNFALGRVSDPRLDLCYGLRGNPPVAAFGWINPVRHAKWIVVAQPRLREVYTVAGGLPVRVTIVPQRGRPDRAVFHTAQYDAHGVLLVRREVVAAVAS